MENTGQLLYYVLDTLFPRPRLLADQVLSVIAQIFLLSRRIPYREPRCDSLIHSRAGFISLKPNVLFIKQRGA